MIEQISVLGQYGALGVIAGLLFYMNFKHQQQMASRLGNLEEQLMDVVKTNTKAMEQLCMTLNQKPCLLERPEDLGRLREAGFIKDKK
ncbi:MAG: hypothetical protein JXR97_16935 [Planctomycetes bacterium]|nr:hypothetical protein [Planctomycetota bacterium]